MRIASVLLLSLSCCTPTTKTTSVPRSVKSAAPKVLVITKRAQLSRLDSHVTHAKVSCCLGAAVARFSTLTALESLKIVPLQTLSAAQLAPLAGCKKLRELVVSTSPKGLATIAKIASLESLSLGGSSIGDDDLALLAGHRRLRLLDLSGTAVTGVGVAKLGAVPLESLRFGVGTRPLAPAPDPSPKAGEAAGIGLGSFGAGALGVQEGEITPAGLEAISRLPGLRRLSLEGGLRLKPEAWRSLGRLAGLRSLDIEVNAKADLGFLPQLTRLERLKVTWIRAPHGDNKPPTCAQLYAWVGKLTRLRSLVLRVLSERTPGCFAKLDQLTKIEHLDLQVAARDSDTASLGRFPLLRELRLVGLFSDKTFRVLAKLAKLTKLRLIASSASSDALARLAKLPLRRLELPFLRTDAAGIAALARFERLRYLDLNRARVSTGALGKLSELKQVTHLVLDRCAELDDSVVSKLAQLTQLVSLSVRNTKLSKDAVAKLRRALPRSTIDARPLRSPGDIFGFSPAKSSKRELLGRLHRAAHGPSCPRFSWQDGR
jgi:hypothetical protein